MSKACSSYNCSKEATYVTIPTTCWYGKNLCKHEFVCRECKDRQIEYGVAKIAYSIQEWNARLGK